MKSNEVGLRSLELEISYIGTDQVLNNFLLPCLQKSIRYSRLTGYFNVDSLLNISQGLESVWRSNGKMRLVIGVHDVDSRLVQAKKLSNEEVDEIYAEIQNNLISDAASLTNEFERDKLATLVWMLKAGLLEVRVAIVKGPLAEGIFHVKRFVFEDSLGNMVTGSGSPNETRPGQVGNFEDVTVHMSWGPDPRYAETLSSQFEKIWNDEILDLKVVQLSDDFTEKLLESIKRKPIPPSQENKNTPLDGLLASVNKSPSLSHLTYPGAILFPHQERALKQAINSNPIRVLLADEVGLGKTLEAGSIIDYSIRFRGVSEVCILTPASIMTQFQDELAQFFGLNFFIWNSSTRKYIDSNKVEHKVDLSGPMDIGRPNLTLISYQLARGSKTAESIFANVDNLPEMLVVDEAHAARIHSEDSGERPTILWKALNEISAHVKHLLLMTATPLQVHPLEFHGLLRLLGLPTEWVKSDNYLRSLDLLASDSSSGNLEDSTLISKLIDSSLQMNQIGMEYLTDVERDCLASMNAISSDDDMKRGLLVRRKFNEFIKILAKTHPAHYLVVRNTRKSLEAIGYSFPEREFIAPELKQTVQIRHFITELEDYLEKGFGLVEMALNPKYSKSLGFVKVSYQQRLASSLNSCHLSLNRRLSKILDLESGETSVTDEFLDLDGSNDDDQEMLSADFSIAKVDDEILQAFRHAATVEKAFLTGLIRKLSELESGFIDGDLKFIGAEKVLSENLPTTKLLVFSRYTDTLDGFVQYLKNNNPSILEDGLGYYTGGDVWIAEGKSLRKSSKAEIRRALDSGRINVVVCSDAASEGLNLQSAQILVNLDVPWNPARLEQRIGRIARLGQKAKTVRIFNFWYPDSVEAKMYSRLMVRRDLYELAVGEFPNIFAQAIRANARVQAQGATNFDLDAINELEEARKAVQSKALAKVWGNQSAPHAISTQIAQEWQLLLNGLDKSDEQYSLPSPVTFGNVDLGKFAFPNIAIQGQTAELLASTFGSIVLGFVLKKDDEYALVKTSSLVRLVESALGMGRLDESDFTNGWIDEDQLISALSNEDFGIFGGSSAARTNSSALIQDKPNGDIRQKDLEYITICHVGIE